jgi:predicted phage gp36 major capsid-like protein
MTPNRLQKPAALPRVAETQAAWTTGWWQGSTTGFVLGLAAAVLLGWLQ